MCICIAAVCNFRIVPESRWRTVFFRSRERNVHRLLNAFFQYGIAQFVTNRNDSSVIPLLHSRTNYVSHYNRRSMEFISILWRRHSTQYTCHCYRYVSSFFMNSCWNSLEYFNDGSALLNINCELLQRFWHLNRAWSKLIVDLKYFKQNRSKRYMSTYKWTVKTAGHTRSKYVKLNKRIVQCAVALYQQARDNVRYFRKLKHPVYKMSSNRSRFETTRKHLRGQNKHPRKLYAKIAQNKRILENGHVRLKFASRY